jgi:hypothetical protein
MVLPGRGRVYVARLALKGASAVHVQIGLAGFGAPEVCVVLMSLGQGSVMQTFALAARFEMGLGLFVMKSGLGEMFCGVVMMMGNLNGHIIGSSWKRRRRRDTG